jgi:hypothetical protein
MNMHQSLHHKLVIEEEASHVIPNGAHGDDVPEKNTWRM